jgi:hypothetical protein
MKYKYKTFDDYFDELENFSMRGDRFHEEFQALDYIKRDRMIEWLKAAFECGREKEAK